MFLFLAKDLIKNLLIVDPTKRFNADQILKHPWVVGIVTPRKALADVTKSIRELNAKKRLKVFSYLENIKGNLWLFLLESTVSCLGYSEIRHDQEGLRVKMGNGVLLENLKKKIVD